MTGWFHTARLAPGILCLTEPAVHDFYRANIHWLAGRDADLLVDTGMGLSPLAPALPATGRPLIAVATHAHVDHAGGLHEFATRAGPVAEAPSFAAMDDAGTLQHWFRAQPDALTALPHPGFRLADWRLTPAPLTRPLAEGDRIDLGDRVFTVLHLPGHSPGSLALLDQRDGLLLAGDAIYDGGLVDDLPGSSIPDYLATMDRLSRLDLRLVLAGHGPPMDGPRMQAIARAYMAAATDRAG